MPAMMILILPYNLTFQNLVNFLSDSSHFVSQSRCKILRHHFSSIDLPVVACPGEINNWGTDRESNSTY